MRLSCRFLMRSLVVMVAVCAVASGVPALAQIRSRVQLVVVDNEGNGLKKAEIVAINQDYKSRIQKGSTKKKGKYTFPFLEKGSYIFEVNFPGYRILKLAVDQRGESETEPFQKEYILGSKDPMPVVDLPQTGDYGYCKIKVTMVKEEDYRQALRALRKPAASDEVVAAPAADALAPSTLGGGKDDAYEQGRVLAETGKHQEAIPLFELRLDEVPDDQAALYALGRSQIETGLTFEAETTLKKLIAVNTNYVSAYYYLGRAQAANFKNAAAIQSYRKEIEISPDRKSSLLGYIANAQVAMSKTNPAALDQAQATLEELLVEDLDNAAALSQLADIYRRKGDTAMQQDAYRRLVEADPENADVTFFNLGAIAFNAGRREEAAAHFEKALETNPNHPGAHFQLGTCLVGMGQFPEAVSHFETYLSLEPDGEHVSSAKGMIAQLSK